MPRYIDEDRLYSNIEEKYKVAQGDARKAYNDVLDTICEIPTADVQDVRHLTPCDFCVFNPPSSGYEKPCSICPAYAKMDEEEQE